MVDEEAADERAEHARHAEDRPEDPLVLATLAGRHHVGDDRLGADHQPAAADALDCAEKDELQQRVGEPGQHRSDQEDDDRGLEEHLAAVQVAELAPQRRGGRRSQQVGRDHPRQMRQPVQIAGDGRQRRRDDRLVEPGQQHPQQQPADDDHDSAVCQRNVGRRRCRGRGRRFCCDHVASVPGR